MSTQEYAFTASLYPLIISVENHCSSAQQAKMANIFQVLAPPLSSSVSSSFLLVCIRVTHCALC